MPVQSQIIRFGKDQVFSGLLLVPPHAPEALPLPSVVIIQEIWGVDGHIRDVAHRVAAAGYAVLAPDLFSEGGRRRPGLEEDRVEEVKLWLNTQPMTVWMDMEARKQALSAEEPAKAARVGDTLGALFGGLQAQREFHLEAVDAAASWLRREGEATQGGRVAAMGFCMGGNLAGQLAVRDKDLAGAVIFYGQAPEPGQVASIACPVLGLYGENDPRTNASVEPFQSAMKAAGKAVDVHFLKGAGHAFMNDTRSSFHAGAAREASARTLTFLHQVLG